MCAQCTLCALIFVQAIDLAELCYNLCAHPAISTTYVNIFRIITHRNCSVEGSLSQPAMVGHVENILTRLGCRPAWKTNSGNDRALTEVEKICDGTRKMRAVLKFNFLPYGIIEVHANKGAAKMTAKSLSIALERFESGRHAFMAVRGDDVQIGWCVKRGSRA